MMSDICSQERKPLLLIEDALDRIKAAIEAVTDTETVALSDALGRILAEPVTSPMDSPPYRNAAMDGYAFLSTKVKTGEVFTLECVGTSWAGQPYQGQVQAGQCIRIFTGAVLPAELDSVIMQEQVQVVGSAIQFPDNTRTLEHVRDVGEDLKKGEVVLPAPKRLTALDLGLLASVGIAQVWVKRKVKIATFSTGDELVEPGEALAIGQIFNSNRYALEGLLNDPSYEVTPLGIVVDDVSILQARLLDAATAYDVIITTGGASVGQADFITEILSRCGEVNFWKLAIKPGKPLAFGKIGGCYFFGLPGNPVAVNVTYQYVVAPALKQLTGAPLFNTLSLTATCTSSLKKSPGRQEYQRGILTQATNGQLTVQTAGKQGSNILSSMSHANCYIILPVACGGVQCGDVVKVDLIPGADLH